MPISIALSAAASAVSSIFASKVFSFIVKAAILFGGSWLLQRANRPDDPQPPDTTRTETFSSGPARWVVGRAKVGGVIMFWGEDWDVKGTERYNPNGGADDAHMVIALSEGEIEDIEGVFIGKDRLGIKYNPDGTYQRREQDKIAADDPNRNEKIKLLPLELDPFVNAYFDEVRNHWRETESLESRRLDPTNREDAEVIRIAHLAGSVSIIPYFDANNTGERWKSLREYTDGIDNKYLYEDNNLNNPRRKLPFADRWTTDHRLQGISGVHVRLRQWTKHNFDERVFRGGTPNISFIVKGIKITYPDTSPGADADATVTQWTDNAAAIRYWWHTQRRGFPTTSIDRNSFVAAYNACNEKIIPERPTEWPNGIQPKWAADNDIWGFSKYSINGVVSSGDNPAQIEEDFDKQWQGQVVEDGGRIFYYPGIDRPVTDTINGNDILAYPQISPAPSLRDRTNAVTVSMRQSSFHDYNKHALSEIVDTEKLEEVDHNFKAPQDLGEWRWVINPAAAYALAVINLRRARHSTTITLHLPPGDDSDPVKYLKMSPGLVYAIDIPHENIIARRMSLQSKEIKEDFSVEATFIDTPIGIFESNYRLAPIPPAPIYIPSEQGALPPKPTNLKVESAARTSNDGSVHFRITATADPHPLQKVWRLRAGDDYWEATTTESNHTFEINAPRQIMELTARHLDKTGAVSLPEKVIFTPGYTNLVLPTPRWKDAFFHGGTLRMSFESDEFVAGVSGVEIRYVRQAINDTSELERLSDATWTILGELLTTKPVQILRGQEIVLDALVHQSGHYNLFARYVSNVSGSEPVRGPISAAREIAIDIQQDALTPNEASPLWNVTYHNLFKWESKYGNTQGENLMLPAFDPKNNPIGTTAVSSASELTIPKSDWDRIENGDIIIFTETGGYSVTKDRTYYARKFTSGSSYRITVYQTSQEAKAGGSSGKVNLGTNGTPANVRIGLGLNSIPFDVWNGYVENSSVTNEPLAYWPFGQAPGYDQNFDTGGRNPSTGLLRESFGGSSTWFMTNPVDLGSSKRVDVRADAYSFAPGTDEISNITFGGTRLNVQQWRHNIAISPVVFPAVTISVGTVNYTMTGLPAGLSFDGDTRTLSGTPTINDTSGNARYTATDALGGSVSLPFAWTVSHALGAPEQVTGLKTSTGGALYNELQIEWNTTSLTNYYQVEWQLSSGGSVTTISPVWQRFTQIKNLSPSTSYRYRVRAINGAGAGVWSAYVTDSTTAAPVQSGAPTGLQVSSRNSDAIVLRWGSVANATSYELRWKLASSPSYNADDIKTNLAATIGQISDLLADTAYTVQVRSRNNVGASDWSTAITASTTTINTSSPTVTITSHSYGNNQDNPYFKIVTNTLTGETGTDIEVTRLRSIEDGGNLPLPTDYYTYSENNAITERTFFYYQGIGPGHTYQIRVRKDLTPRSGIGLSRYSAWTTVTITFEGVPLKPAAVRNLDSTPRATSIQVRGLTVPTATRYRIRYWPENMEASALQTTFDAPATPGPITHNITGLTDETTYEVTLEAYNEHGWSLPSNVASFTLPKYYRRPTIVTGVKGLPLTENSVILGWNEEARSASYEIRVSGGGVTQTQTGITGNSFVFGNLEPSTTYNIRIRGYQPLVVVNNTDPSKYGPWRSFTSIRTPPASHGDSPYRFRDSNNNIINPITLSNNSTNPRKIDWSFTAPRAAGVTGLQIRFRQSPTDSDNKVPDWVIGYENIFNVSFTNDGDVYTGSFDPGFSSRLWEVEARVLVSEQDDLPYDAGFSEWGKMTNSATDNQGNILLNTFKNGAKPMTAPTPRVRQSFDFARNRPSVFIDWVPDVEDWENPTDNSGDTRNEIQITYNGRVRPIIGLKHPEINNFNRRFRIDSAVIRPNRYKYTQASEITFSSIFRLLPLFPYYETLYLNPGTKLSVQIVRVEKGRQTVSSPSVDLTIVAPSDAPTVNPNIPKMLPTVVSGRDVQFNWGPVAGVNGYEVRLFEDEYGSGQTIETVEQDNDIRQWTKYGAINEHFKVQILAFRGTSARKLYSAPLEIRYQPAEEVGKIVGLRATPNGNDLDLTWKALPGDNDDFRYERQFSDDGGTTWTSPHLIPTSDWYSGGTIEHTMTNYANANTLLRLIAYKLVNGNKVYSKSYTSMRWHPTGTVAVGALNPINTVVAGARDGNIILDWTPPEHDDDHPEATRYRIEFSHTNGGSWGTLASNISGNLSAWQTTNFSSADARWFRIRPETYEQNGEWTLIAYTPETAASVGQVDATGSATYTTMTANWVPTSNAEEYELQWKEGTSGFSGAGGATGVTTTITGIQANNYTVSSLDAGDHYQMRIRGIAGGSSGAYSDTIDIDTLAPRILPAPTGVTLSSTVNNLRVTWNAVADATGYEIRCDGKPAGSAVYAGFNNVVVKETNSTTTEIDINRSEFGQTLYEQSFDVRVRVRALFNDSPTETYSDYVTIRWLPGGWVAPPNENSVVVNASTGTHSITNPHFISGVNGVANLFGLGSATTSGRPRYINYTVATKGRYTFISNFHKAGASTQPSSMLELSLDGSNILATSNSNTAGEAEISYDLNPGSVWIIFKEGTNAASTADTFTLQISGPAPVILPPEIIVSPSGSYSTPGEVTAVDVKLSKQPSSTTVVNISSQDTEVTTSKSSMTFTRDNWNTEQSLNVTLSSSVSSQFTGRVLFSTGQASTRFPVTALLSTTKKSVLYNNAFTEIDESTSRTFRVRLSHLPTGNVTVSLSVGNDNNDSLGTLSPTSLTFTTSNWDTYQNVTFTANAINNQDGIRGTINLSPSGGGYNNTDNGEVLHFLIKDVAVQQGTITTSTSLLEIVEGNSATFTAKLGTQPGSNRTVNLAVSPTAHYSVSPSSLNFTPSTWNTAQTITITSTQDDSSLQGATGRCTLSGTGLISRNVTLVTNNDTQGTAIFTPATITMTEGTSQTVSVRLSHQLGQTVNFSSGNSNVTFSPSQLVFTNANWNTDQTLTISAANNGSTQNYSTSITASPQGLNFTTSTLGVNVNKASDPNKLTLSTNTFNHPLFGNPTMSIITGNNGTISIPSTNSGWQRFGENDGNTSWLYVAWNLTTAGTYTIRVQQNNQKITRIQATAHHTTVPTWRDVLNSNFDPNDLAAGEAISATHAFTITSNNPNHWLTFRVVGGDTHPEPFNITITPVSGDPGGASALSLESDVKASIASGTNEATAERVEIDTSHYENVIQPTLNAAVLPTFNGHIPTQCWLSGSAIDDYKLPSILNGLPPYTIEVDGLPAGITFDADTRTISGTPTDSSPLGGTSIITLRDANGNSEIVEMDWAIASGVPASWTEFGGGFGQFNNPFQMTCTTKGNVKPFYYVQGGTTAQKIIDNDTGARARAIWLQCPTTYPHTARLIGADSPDYDLIIKVGDDWYVSDTNDKHEMLSVPGHSAGALIGIFRYESTQTSTGVNNTGDPLTLEWFPDVEHLPTEVLAFGQNASAQQERGSNIGGQTPGDSETDIYVLYRNSETGAWTRRNTPITGWTALGTDARQIRFEVHLKKWRNRALRRFTSFYRDSD